LIELIKVGKLKLELQSRGAVTSSQRHQKPSIEARLSGGLDFAQDKVKGALGMKGNDGSNPLWEGACSPAALASSCTGWYKLVQAQLLESPIFLHFAPRDRQSRPVCRRMKTNPLNPVQNPSFALSQRSLSGNPQAMPA
jgi:hypothetical protein